MHASVTIWTLLSVLHCLQVYPWGSFEEDEPGEQYFQNLPTSSASASPAVSAASSAADTNLGQPPPILAPRSPPSPSPSPHLSNTDVLGEDTYVNTYCIYVNFYTVEPVSNTCGVSKGVFFNDCLCLCDLQLHTTQVKAWPTPALPTPSQPVGSCTQLMSRRGSHQGKQHKWSGFSQSFLFVLPTFIHN